MGNPLISKPAINKKFVDVPHSAGILDDFAVRKSVETQELNALRSNNTRIVTALNSDRLDGLNCPEVCDVGFSDTITFNASVSLHFSSATEKVAQPFIAKNSFLLKKVELYLNRGGTNPNKKVWLSIYDDNAGVPGNELTKSLSLNYDDITDDDGWNSFYFSDTEFTFVKGTRYYLVLDGDYDYSMTINISWLARNPAMTDKVGLNLQVDTWVEVFSTRAFKVICYSFSNYIPIEIPTVTEGYLWSTGSGSLIADGSLQLLDLNDYLPVGTKGVVFSFWGNSFGSTSSCFTMFSDFMDVSFSLWTIPVGRSFLPSDATTNATHGGYTLLPVRTEGDRQFAYHFSDSFGDASSWASGILVVMGYFI
jgi:hypothetical protein